MPEKLDITELPVARHPEFMLRTKDDRLVLVTGAEPYNLNLVRAFVGGMPGPLRPAKVTSYLGTSPDETGRVRGIEVGTDHGTGWWSMDGRTAMWNGEPATRISPSDFDIVETADTLHLNPVSNKPSKAYVALS